MKSDMTRKMKCLWANWFGVRMSMKNGRLKIGKAFAFAMIVSCLYLAIITPQRAVTVAHAKSAAEERATQIETGLLTRAEFFGATRCLPYPTGEARALRAAAGAMHPRVRT